MSWRRQVKKIPHFRVVPKWWVGSSQTRFRMDWTCQASSNTPRQPSDIPQDCLRVSVGVLLCLIHLWECKGASWGGCFRVFLVLGGVRGCNGRLSLCGSRLAGANPPFCHSPKMQDFFHLTLLWHQNIKTSLCARSKNGSVMPLFVIVRPIRKKLQLTVSFDHPVV